MLKNDGTVWAWGWNKLGMIGDGTTDNKSRPIKVPIDDVKEIASGDSIAMALKNDGTVWVWGTNLEGEYGNGTIYPSTGQYQKMPSIPCEVPNLYDVREIAAGTSSCFVIKNDGTVLSWGSNTLGLLGDGSTTMRSTPVQVKGLTNIVAISSNADHTMALDSNGKVWAWGEDDYGELGNNSADQVNEHGFKYAATPVLVPIDNVVAISAGQGFSLALKRDMTVWAWGNNELGNLGDGTSISSLTPVSVSGLNNIVDIQSIGAISIALKNDGTLWMWGLDTGIVNRMSSTNSFSSPVQLDQVTDVKKFALGNDDILVLKNDGTLWAWGDNLFGQLGIGKFNDFPNYQVITPTKVLLDPNSPIEVDQSPSQTTDTNTTFINDTNRYLASNGNPTLAVNADAVTNSTFQSPNRDSNNFELYGLLGLIAIVGIAVYLWFRRYR